MPNGYIVGHILDQNSPWNSTAAKVEIWKGATKVRTLYPTKVATAQYWYYSTSIAPYDSYTVKGFDTSVVPYTYQPQPANVPDSLPVTVDLNSRAPGPAKGYRIDPHHKPVVDFLKALWALFLAVTWDIKIKDVHVALEIDEK